MYRRVALVCTLLWLLVGCSSPTAPSPPPVTASASPPVIVTPDPPVAPTPAPNPLLTDPRFDRNFYRQFALGTLEGGPYRLRRLTQAPRIYLRTVDDAGRPIDTGTLNQTAEALINVAGSLTGVFGLAGLERGAETREGHTGWITVRWSDQTTTICGIGEYGGDLMVLYPRTAGCRCSGGPAVTLTTVKHELGHVLGFYHTDSRSDLMHHLVGDTCDKNPSAREVFHARIAYSMPVGSMDP